MVALSRSAARSARRRSGEDFGCAAVSVMSAISSPILAERSEQMVRGGERLAGFGLNRCG
jgi:hypothetical protein